MNSLLIAIALLCQVPNGQSGNFTIQNQQIRCQQKLVKCATEDQLDKVLHEEKITECVLKGVHKE